MEYMPVTESMFLIAETRDQPMHVAGLQLFIPREGQTAEELADEVDSTFRAATDIQKAFRKRPATPANIAGYTAWQYDDEIDFDYHIRRIILPRPGRVRDLLRYVSLNHGGLLDRRRPMWELHIIEGLADGRLAVYTKIHHSVVDGVTATRMLQRMLSSDPDDRTGTAIWDNELLRRRRARRQAKRQEAGTAEPAESSGLLSAVSGAFGAVRDTVGSVADLTGQAVGMVPAVGKVAFTSLTNDDYVAPLQPSPRTLLNVPIGSARRFAAQDWPIERLSAAARAQGMTMNDVVLAMCSGALRSYLSDNDGLPDDSLVAMVPVSMHGEGEKDGNAVTAISVRLATEAADPADRVAAIRESTQQAKNMVRGLPWLQALALGGATILPLAFTTLPGFVRFTPPTFNLIISNVPGPEEQLYWNGAKLDGSYPVSIVVEGQAMNITVTTLSGKVNFGIIGARAELPKLQRMLDHLETALAEIEQLEPASAE